MTRAPQRGRDKALATASDGTKHFLLVSNLPPPLHVEYVRDRAKDADRGLTMVVLSAIEVAGGKLTEGGL